MDHFADVSKMIKIGKGGNREVDDSMSGVLTMPGSQEYAQKVIRLYLEDIPPKK